MHCTGFLSVFAHYNKKNSENQDGRREGGSRREKRREKEKEKKIILILYASVRALQINWLRAR